MKGSSGTKACLHCKNVVGKRTRGIEADPYFVTLDVARYSRLDLHTNESLTQVADLLAVCASTYSSTALGKLEQMLGMNHALDSCLFDQTLRPHVRPVDCVLWDWMHVLVAGGLVSHEAALFVRVLRDGRISLAALDAFTSQVQGLKGFDSGRAPADFFQSRFHTSKGADSIKSFAKEMMAVAVTLRFFIELVLMPQRICERHYVCFLHLCRILDLCSIGDAVLQHLDLLRATIEAHHTLFCELYGAELAFPKFHYTMHLPQVFQAAQTNISSFVVERKHRCAKRIANRVFCNFEHTLAHVYDGLRSIRTRFWVCKRAPFSGKLNHQKWGVRRPPLFPN